jgi:hypothetical protein
LALVAYAKEVHREGGARGHDYLIEFIYIITIFESARRKVLADFYLCPISQHLRTLNTVRCYL